MVVVRFTLAVHRGTTILKTRITKDRASRGKIGHTQGPRRLGE
jgi:hypothetical protein